MLPLTIRAALLSLALSSPAALAVDRMPSHNHHLPPAGLHLDHGQRWETNAVLRQGMGGIREALMGAMHADAGGPLTAAAANRLADAIRTQVDYLVANCVLAPEADAVLHVLLGKLLEGAAGLRHDPADEAALQDIIQALKDYPVYFDDAGWKPVTAPAP